MVIRLISYFTPNKIYFNASPSLLMFFCRPLTRSRRSLMPPNFHRHLTCLGHPLVLTHYLLAPLYHISMHPITNTFLSRLKPRCRPLAPLLCSLRHPNCLLRSSCRPLTRSSAFKGFLFYVGEGGGVYMCIPTCFGVGCICVYTHVLGWGVYVYTHMF